MPPRSKQPRTQSIDERAPVIRRARFAPHGRLILVDHGLGEVVLTGPDLRRVRTIGRRGRGPGEYSTPVDAVQAETGEIFIIERTPPRLLVFDSLGVHVETVALPIFGGGSVAVDDTAVYVSSPIPWHSLRAEQPVVIRYRRESKELDTLVVAGPTWRGRPPVYNNPLTPILLRVGLDGALYAGFPEAFLIWRIDGPGRHREIVRGCVPEALLKEYREPQRERAWRRTVNFVADFLVLADGRVLVRVGAENEAGLRPLELYGPDGRLQHAWLLGPRMQHAAEAAIDPRDPTRIVTWFVGTGASRLHRVDIPALRPSR